MRLNYAQVFLNWIIHLLTLRPFLSLSLSSCPQLLAVQETVLGFVELVSLNFSCLCTKYRGKINGSVEDGVDFLGPDLDASAV